jgi:serine/threonine protein kinase
MAHEQSANCEGDQFNPVTTDRWRWKAPELMTACLNEEETSFPCVTKATDVYAFACVAYEVSVSGYVSLCVVGKITNDLQIFSGCLPFSQIKNDASVILSVVAGIRPMRQKCWSINDEIWITMEQSWDVDPNRRPSMDSLSHFFAMRATSALAQPSMPHARL